MLASLIGMFTLFGRKRGALFGAAAQLRVSQPKLLPKVRVSFKLLRI